jgi:hypothetical protein
MSTKEKAAGATAASLRPVSGQQMCIRIIRDPRGNASTLTMNPGHFMELRRISTEPTPI